MVSLPLLIARVNVPFLLLSLEISYLRLSSVPLANTLFARWLPLLFIVAPSPSVWSLNGTFIFPISTEFAVGLKSLPPLKLLEVMTVGELLSKR